MEWRHVGKACSLKCAQERIATLQSRSQAPRCGGKWGEDGAKLPGGCGKPFTDADYVYRCVECEYAFHKECAIKHFAESGSAHYQDKMKKGDAA